MSAEQRLRLRQRIKPITVFILLGTLYYIWLKITGIGIPCIFRKVTGFLCPGCGITRMAEKVVQLDFKAAFYCNKAAFCTLPFLGIVYVAESVHFIKTGKTEYTMFSKVTVIVICVILILYGIVRNI